MTNLHSIWNSSQFWVVVGVFMGVFGVGWGYLRPEPISATMFSTLGGALVASALILELIRGKEKVDTSSKVGSEK